MLKVNLLVGVVVAFLLFWNISYRFKEHVYKTVTFPQSDPLVNFGLLVILTVTFFGIGDVVTLLMDQVSSRIRVT